MKRLLISLGFALLSAGSSYADFSAYTDIYIDGYSGNPVSNFPVLVKINNTKLPGVYSAVMHDGADLKFTDENGNGNYPFDVDTWNPSGDSYVWVKLPSFSSTTKFRMYYGDNSITQNNSVTNVWEGYDLVCHLNESVADSSPNNVKGMLNDLQIPGVVAGQIGKGYVHSTTGLGPVFGNYIYPGHGISREVLPNGKFTVSCWLKSIGNPVGNGRIFNVVEGINAYYAYADPSGKINVSPGKDGGNFTSSRSGASIVADTWTKLDVIFDDSTIYVYVNGQSWGSKTVDSSAKCGFHPWITWGGSGYVAAKDVITFTTLGDSSAIGFDECRIYGSVASEDRLAADYFVVQNDACSFGSGPVIPKKGLIFYIRGKDAPPIDDDDDDQDVHALSLPWNVQVMTPNYIVLQYDGYHQMATNAVNNSTCTYLSSIGSMISSGNFTVTGNGVTEVGHAVQVQGQMSYKDSQGHNRMHGTYNGNSQVRPVFNIYIRLTNPLQDGVANTVVLPDGTRQSFTYHASDPLPIFKVNQAGYLASAGKKYVYLGGWLGNGGGELPLNDSYSYEIVNKTTGAMVDSGTFTKCAADKTCSYTAYRWTQFEKTCSNVPLTGEKTLEADISSLTTPGEYYIRISGLGRSMNFRVNDNAMADQFALHMHGFYMQRCGCAKAEPYTHHTDAACHLTIKRGVHPPNDDEYEKRFSVSQTDHFGLISQNASSCTETLSNVIGGWHDAADYDRRPYHLQSVCDLAMLYLMRTNNFFDGQLAMPENNNGIPDILDEADWGLKYLLAVQQNDGGVGGWIETTGHPGYGNPMMPSADHTAFTYYLGIATHRSTIKYCGAAALLARALYAANTPESRARADIYKASAVNAWNYVKNHTRVTATMKGSNGANVTYTEPTWYDPYEYVRAIVNLGEITNDPQVFACLSDTIKCPPGGSDPGESGTYHEGTCDSIFGISWGPMAEDESFGRSGYALNELWLPSTNASRYASIKTKWQGCVTRNADKMLTQLSSTMAYRIPWWGVDDGRFWRMTWGAVIPLRRAMWLCSAHFITGDAKYLTGAQLACDFQSGCNPKGSTWTTGLGKVYPVKFLNLHSFADDIDEYIYGITPFYNTCGEYENLRNGNSFWTNYEPELQAKPVFRRAELGENLSIGISEYTINQTQAPCCATTGYLIVPGHTEANLNWKQPASDIRDLPGYWALP